MTFYPLNQGPSIAAALAGQTVPGNLTVAGNVTTTSLGVVSAAGGFNAGVGSVDVPQAGAGLKVAEGSNAKQGVATLVAGTVTVANTSVTANSRIFLSVFTPGGTQGILSYSKTAGTGFTITSTNAADTSVVNWEIFEPG